jgi:hypothetical protein
MNSTAARRRQPADAESPAASLSSAVADMTRDFPDFRAPGVGGNLELD